MTGTLYVENNVGRALHDAINLFTHNHGWTAVWQNDIHPEMQRRQHGDEWWIRDIAGRGFAILTQDRAILDDPDERAVVVEAGASIVAFGDANMLQWNKLRCLITHWGVIVRTLEAPGPQAVTVWLTKYSVDVFDVPPVGGGAGEIGRRSEPRHEDEGWVAVEDEDPPSGTLFDAS